VPRAISLELFRKINVFFEDGGKSVVERPGGFKFSTSEGDFRNSGSSPKCMGGLRLR